MADDEEDVVTSKLSLKALAGVVSAVGVLVGAVITVESRYVHSEEYLVAQSTLGLKLDASTYDQRKWLLNDRITSIEAKPESARTDYDRAQLLRYQRELEETDKRLRELEKEMRQAGSKR